MKQKESSERMALFLAKFPARAELTFGQLNALRAHFFMPCGVTATHLTSVLVGARVPRGVEPHRGANAELSHRAVEISSDVRSEREHEGVYLHT